MGERIDKLFFPSSYCSPNCVKRLSIVTEGNDAKEHITFKKRLNLSTKEIGDGVTLIVILSSQWRIRQVVGETGSHARQDSDSTGACSVKPRR